MRVTCQKGQGWREIFSLKVLHAVKLYVFKKIDFFLVYEWDGKSPYLKKLWMVERERERQYMFVRGSFPSSGTFCDEGLRYSLGSKADHF